MTRLVRSNLRLRLPIWATVLVLVLPSACEHLDPYIGSTGSTAPPDSAEARRTLALAEQELEVAELLLALGFEHLPSDADLVNVRVVDPEAETVAPPGCVRIRRGRITALEDTCPEAPGVERIDGGGRYLVPGLADMHVHQLETVAIPLLNVVHGVTTVRDMDGFPWMLKWRQVAEGALLAPNIYVTGRILNGVSFGWYTRVVENEEEARRAVREQAADGYDAIKIHNALPLPLFDAVIDEAGKVGLDVVGHVPKEVSVAHAIESGTWTLEHLTGYLDDRTLGISEEDWLTPSRGADVWHCPTLYSDRMWLHGEAVETWMASPEAAWVPLLRRQRWQQESVAPAGPSVGLPERKRTILRRLLRVTDRVIAGTDSGGGYPFLVPGAGLHDELANLQEVGLSPAAALRAATTDAARALRWEGEVGMIAPGVRADLVLVRDDPLDDVANLRRIEGVMLHGVWLDRAALDDALARLEEIQARRPAVVETGGLDEAWVDGFLASVEEVRRAGYVVPDHHLRDAAAALEATGYDAAARWLWQPVGELSAPGD